MGRGFILGSTSNKPLEEPKVLRNLTDDDWINQRRLQFDSLEKLTQDQRNDKTGVISRKEVENVKRRVKNDELK